MNELDIADKALGALLGLAVGDAVGTTVEAMPPGSFEPVTDMIGGGKFSLQPGQWTDDTSMALCLAESLIHCQGFNPIDQADRYWSWYQEGHLSSNGQCFDIGMCTRKALHKFNSSGGTAPYCGSRSEQASGNGSLMRLSPVPLMYCRHPLVAMELSEASSLVTHGGPAALEACRYYSGLLVGALNGASKQQLLSSLYSPIPHYWDTHPLVTEVGEVAKGSFITKQPPEIKGKGYVVNSLEAALWAFHNSSNFKDGCLLVVNIGNDADTTAAIYGQLAGAYYGAKCIPQEWSKNCALSALIELFATELLRQSACVTVPIDMTGNFPSPNDTGLPEAYLLPKQGYDLLEAGNKEVVRKLNPCPKQYRSLEQFDDDASLLISQFQELPPLAQHPAILADFQQRWVVARKKLETKFSRNTITK